MSARSHMKFALRMLHPVMRLLERLSALLPGVPEQAHTPAAAAGGAIRLGLWLVALVFGVFGLWSALAPLESAAVAPGQVVLDTNRKTIQHLEGGLVEAVLVREGERVEAGQALLRLRGTAFKAKQASLAMQHFTARAAEQRLKAEQAMADELAFTDTLAAEAQDDAAKQEVLANQRELFASRRKVYGSQRAALREKIKEYQHDIEGLSTQERAEAEQIALLKEEIASTKSWWRKAMPRSRACLHCSGTSRKCAARVGSMCRPSPARARASPKPSSGSRRSPRTRAPACSRN